MIISMTTFVCQKQLPALQKIQTMASKTAAYSSWCPISIIRCLHFRPAGHLWHPNSWPKKHKYAEQLQIAFCSNESNHMQRVKKKKYVWHPTGRSSVGVPCLSCFSFNQRCVRSTLPDQGIALNIEQIQVQGTPCCFKWSGNTSALLNRKPIMVLYDIIFINHWKNFHLGKRLL